MEICIKFNQNKCTDPAACKRRHIKLSTEELNAYKTRIKARSRPKGPRFSGGFEAASCVDIRGDKLQTPSPISVVDIAHSSITNVSLPSGTVTRKRGCQRASNVCNLHVGLDIGCNSLNFYHTEFMHNTFITITTWCGSESTNRH